METNYAVEIVRQERLNTGNVAFRVTTSDRIIPKIRLFVTKEGNVAEFRKGSRRWGYTVNVQNWQKIEPIHTKEKTDVFFHNVKRIIAYLTASGLWPNILEALKKLEKIDPNELKSWENKQHAWREYEGFANTLDIRTISSDEFFSLWDPKCIKTAAFGKWSDTKQKLTEHMMEKTAYSDRWRGSYDYSIEYNPDKKAAWYSEEYKNCGNGHYWLMLDNMHVAFREDD